MKWRVVLPIFFLGLIWLSPKLISTSVGKIVIVKVLEKKTKTHIQLESLHLSWLGPQEANGLQVSSDLMYSSAKQLTAYMPLWRLPKHRGLFSLTEGYLRMRTPSGQEAILESVDAKIDNFQFTAAGSTRQGSLKGSFSINGQVKEFPDSYALQGQMSSIPSLFLDFLLDLRYQVTEILGDSFDLEGSIDANKNKTILNLNLASSNARAEIGAELDGKIVRLQKPLTASCRLTPALSQTLMKEVNPLFMTAVQSQSPIILKIAPEKFELSYDPFDLKNLVINEASLDMGRAIIQNGPSLQSLIQLLQSRRLSGRQQMNAWFTPVSFQVQNGVLFAGRLDALLADSIHICSWGKVNLLNEELNMYIGLPADTLASSFGITGLSSDYVLKIPLRGTISNPDLVTSPAVAQITSMAATQALPVPKVGKVLDKITKTASQIKNDKDVPPAKRPFPWE